MIASAPPSVSEPLVSEPLATEPLVTEPRADADADAGPDLWPPDWADELAPEEAEAEVAAPSAARRDRTRPERHAPARAAPSIPAPAASGSAPNTAPSTAAPSPVATPIPPPTAAPFLVAPRSSAESQISMLTIVLRSTGDKIRDVLRLRRIHAIITSYPGEDRFAFQVFEGGKGYRLEFPNFSIGINNDMIGRVAQLIGQENILREPITFQ
jgi:DNA polymerase-3 subunit alpha